MYTVIIHFLPNQAIYKWIIVRVWLVKILTVEIKSSLTTRKFYPSPEVVSLTGSCLNSSQRKYLSEFLTHRFPNFRKKSFGISRPWYDWKNKCFGGLRLNDFDKKSSKLTKMPKFDSFCNIFFRNHYHSPAGLRDWSLEVKQDILHFQSFWSSEFDQFSKKQLEVKLTAFDKLESARMINNRLKWGASSWSDLS